MLKLLKFLIKVSPFLYMALVWIMSSMPADAIVRFSVADSFIKESLHLIEFAILYLLFVGFLLAEGKLTIKTNWFVAVISMMYGVIDEIHQYFVPYRSATVIDVIKDVTGVLVCYWIVYYSYFVKKNLLGSFMQKVGGWLTSSYQKVNKLG
jgi:hypothetical protein